MATKVPNVSYLFALTTETHISGSIYICCVCQCTCIIVHKTQDVQNVQECAKLIVHKTQDGPLISKHVLSLLMNVNRQQKESITAGVKGSDSYLALPALRNSMSGRTFFFRCSFGIFKHGQKEKIPSERQVRGGKCLVDQGCEVRLVGVT